MNNPMKSINVDLAVDLINTQLDALKKKQKLLKKTGTVVNMTPEVNALMKSLATMLAELRKAGEAAEDMLANLTPEQHANLVLKLVADLPADHQEAVMAYLVELRGQRLNG